MSRTAGSPLGGLAPLGGRRFSRIQNLAFFPSLASTNDVARAFVERALSEGEEMGPTVVSARVQTAGRGRAGRDWTNPKGTVLAVSLIVPWPEGPGRIRVPVEYGVGLAKSLSARYALDVRLKWPNDLLVSKKKLGGILVEARAGPEGEGYAVVGIGLNVKVTRADLDAAGLPDATSLLVAGVPAAELAGDGPLVALLTMLDDGLETPIVDLPAAFDTVSAHAKGDALVLTDAGRTVEGVYAGVTADGLLKLKTVSGVETLVSGDVTSF